MKKLFLAIAVLLCASGARATDYTSSNFIVRDPVLSIQGGLSVSSTFRLFQATGQVVAGRSTSTNFELRSGFLYFPLVTAPVVTATAGVAQVALSWTAAVGSLGLNVSGYQVGRSTTAGGPYTYTNVGDVLSTTVTGLSGGTTYYFVVRALDAFSNPIATSAEVSATPTAAAGGGAVPGAGGGAGTQTSTVDFSGTAYPNAVISVLKDGQPAAIAQAAIDGSFRVLVSGLSPGTYTFLLLARDDAGRLSRPVTVTVEVPEGRTVAISGILFPPTLEADFEEVPSGAALGFFGASPPSALINIYVDGALALQGLASPQGLFGFKFDTRGIARGDHHADAEDIFGGKRSGRSNEVIFRIGDRTVPKIPGPPVITPPGTPPGRGACAGVRADFNCDGRVNLIDLSIMLYWWEKTLSPVALERVDLTGDGAINIYDFSVLVYYWTG